MHKDALAIVLVAVALAWPGSAPTAEKHVAAPSARLPAEELEEVLVTAHRASDLQQDPQIYFDWLARLVGEFTVEGYVDLTPRNGDRELLTADGTAGCVGFGVAPGVQCDLHVRWPRKTTADGKEIPGAAPTLDPAMMLFGFKENAYNFDTGEYETLQHGIAHAVIDSRGIFESGVAVHEGEDTVVSRSHCAAVRMDCERLVRITAAPDLREIDMVVELTIDQHKAVRYVLLMSRVPGSKAQVFGRKAPKEQPK